MAVCAYLPVAIATFFGCPDETISGFVDTAVAYRLTTIDGAAFEASATINFQGQGDASGEGPCNRWSAEQRVPYPWFELGPIAATKRACADLEAEATFFQALGEMSLAEVSGTFLILSNDDGREMVFEAQTP